MRFLSYLIIVCLMVGAAVLIDSIRNSSGGSRGKEAVVLMWDDLYRLDVQSGEASAKLKKNDGHRVKIPGFAVPLGDNLKTISEFLLVPDPMSCIHVPPPPPNQIVHIKLDRSIAAEELYGPVWAFGVLRIGQIESVYGAAGFSMEADTILPYE